MVEFELSKEIEKHDNPRRMRIKPTYSTDLFLNIDYRNIVRKFVYPPLVGTYGDSFSKIYKNPRVRAAEGMDIALLIEAIYSNNDKDWRPLRQNCIVKNRISLPVATQWIPKNYMKEDKSISGIIIKRDLPGVGFLVGSIPPSLSFWHNDNGYSESQFGDMKFIPEHVCDFGEQARNKFSENPIAHALFTPEGADIVAKTAHDAKKKLYITEIAEKGKDVSKLKIGDLNRQVYLREFKNYLIVENGFDYYERPACAFSLRTN